MYLSEEKPDARDLKLQFKGKLGHPIFFLLKERNSSKKSCVTIMENTNTSIRAENQLEG